MRRFAWFDCFRFVAIFLVMCAHAPDLWRNLPEVVGVPFLFLQLIGWVGVDLFFVLSGFLVSGLLFDEHDATGTLNIQRFLIRRGFKIIPAFYVLVFITAIYDWFAEHQFNPVHIFHDLLFLQSYRMGSWAHAWTLAIEVHFYLLLALLLWFLARHPPKSGAWLARLPAIIGWILVIEFFARWINSALRPGEMNVHREFQPTHLHLDVLAAGVLLRYLYTYHHDRLAFLARLKLPAVLLGLVLVSPSVYLWRKLWPMHPDFITAIIPTANYLGFALILFVATQVAFPARGPLHWLVKPFDYFGKHSYSIYLWHLPVKEWLVDPYLKGVSAPVYFAAFVLGSLAVGTFFSEILEMPVLHLRNKLFPSNARPHLPDDPGTKAELPPEELR
jgi:peptidoglycan/LPS O-acetylase OafA/YrhL